MDSRPPKRVGLEVIRALAALLVVYNHIFTFGLIPKSGLLELPAQFATEAVVIFFVLSGTVITLATESRARTELRPAALLSDYLRARFVRIYLIFAVGLILAAIVQRWLDGAWMSNGDLVGNVFFLQSLSGFIVSAPKYNPPLWSLSNEIAYYLLFALSLVVGRVILVWTVAAVLCAALLYPPVNSGVGAHLVFVLALSVPWIMGHAVAAGRHRLPRIPVALGFAFLVIGLVYARTPLTSDFYDAFRLTAFAACCCPLVLSLIQDGPTGPHEYRVWRLAVASLGIALMWMVSPSLLVVKAGLTGVGLLFAVLRLDHIQAGLSCFRHLVPTLTYLGSISYAVYALHAPLVVAVAHLLGDRPLVLRLGVFAVAVLALSHVMERVIQPRLSPRRRPSPPAAGEESAGAR